MSATNTTTYYNLSQFIGTDKPAWLQDYNGDMLKIDTAINNAKLAADSAANAASAAQNDATAALGDFATLSGTVSTISNTLGTAVGNINTINSLIGNGTPTTTDQTIIGAINELHADQGDLADLTTPDQSSLVNAINSSHAVIDDVSFEGITSDGTNTWAELVQSAVNAANTAMAASDPNYDYELVYVAANSRFHIAEYPSIGRTIGTVETFATVLIANTLVIEKITVSPTLSSCAFIAGVITSAPAFTTTDSSNTAAASGNKVTIVLRRYKNLT